MADEWVDIAPDDEITTGSTPAQSNDGWEDVPQAAAAPTEQPVVQQQAADQEGWEDVPPLESTAAGAFTRGAAESGITLAGALPAIGLGASVGGALAAPTVVGAPIGAFVGGVVGGIAGAAGVEMMKNWALRQLGLREGTGFFSEAQQQADVEQHPTAKFSGELSAMALGFGPGLAKQGITRAMRAASGTLMGGLEVGQELVNEGKIDPGHAAAAFLVGAALPAPYKATQAVINLGSRAAAPLTRAIESRFPPGRPDQAPSPTVDAEKAAAAQSVEPNISQGVAQEKGPPPDAGVTTPAADSTIGNPQSAPVGSSRDGYKPEIWKYSSRGPEVDLIPKDAVAAIDASVDSARAPEIVPKVETAKPAAEEATPRETPEVGTKPGGHSEIPEAVPKEQPKFDQAQAERAAKEAATQAVDEAITTGSLKPESRENAVSAVQQKIVDQLAKEYADAFSPKPKVEATKPGAGIAEPVAPEKPAQPMNMPAKSPTLVKKTLKELEARGQKVVADQIRALPADQQVAAAARANASLVNKGGEVKKPGAELESQRYRNPETKGRIRLEELGGVEVGTKAEAATKVRAFNAIKKAFEAHQPVQGETVEATKARLTQALADAKIDNRGNEPLFKMAKLPKEMLWYREAQKLLRSKTISPEKHQKFIADELLARGGKESAETLRAGQRVEGDIAFNKRREMKEFPGEPVPAEDEGLPQRVEAVKPESRAEELKRLTAEQAAEDTGIVGERDFSGGAETAAPKLSYKELEAQRALATAAKRAAQAEARKGKGATRPTEAPAKSSTVEQAKEPVNLLRQLAKDEAGYINPTKAMNWLKSTAARFKPSKDQFARTPQSPAEEYARSLSQDLNTKDKTNIAATRKWQQAGGGIYDQFKKLYPKDTDKVLESVYHAREANEIGKLPVDVQNFYNKHMKPIFEEGDRLYAEIEKLAPKMLGDKVQFHTTRIRKGFDPKLDALNAVSSVDPVEGLRQIFTGKRGSANDRVFVGLERVSDGKRIVISKTEDGYTKWDKGSAHEIKDPTFKFDRKNTYTDQNGTTYKMIDPTTKEIEANAKFEDGKMARYYHNPILSGTISNAYLENMLGNLRYVDRVKRDPTFHQYATLDAAQAKEKGWGHTQLEQFDQPGPRGRWYMDDQLRYLFDSYAKPGVLDNSLMHLKNLSSAVTKLLFWNPVAHIANVGGHWVVARGWGWIEPLAYRRLVSTGYDSIKSVITQDAFNQQMLKEGSGLLLPGILSKDMVRDYGRRMGEAIERAPAKWDPIARAFGVGPSDLARAIYENSSKLMWGANDIFLQQLVREGMAEGLTMRESMIKAERQFPNYRVNATLMGSGKAAHAFSRVMQEPTLTAFGRYHVGIFNAYANTVKELVAGTPEQKIEAVGHLVAMGIFAFIMKPVYDMFVRGVTDNKHAESRAPGPLSVPHALIKAAQGKQDPMQAVRNTITISPYARTALDLYGNKTFAGKNIIEPGDVKKAFQGSPRAAGRVLVQGGQQVATSMVAPLGQAVSAIQRRQGIPEAIRDQLLNIREPTPGSIKYEAKAGVKAAGQREKKPPNPIEGLYNRLTR